MQTSNSKIAVVHSLQRSAESEPNVQHHACGLVLSILIFACLFSLWLMQHSVNAYVQQTYHRDSPLVFLDQYQLWRLGGELGLMLGEQKEQLDVHIQLVHQQIMDEVNTWLVHPLPSQAKQPVIAADISINVDTPHAEQQVIGLPSEPIEATEPMTASVPVVEAMIDNASIMRIELTAKDQVLFAGDSLMQGVAPHVQKQLSEQYQLKSLNLSKQSTGLTYTKLFDWPTTIRQTLKAQPQIKLLVVFLGPNDPWDLYDEKQWLKFGTPTWAAAYQKRIAQIIHDAKAQGTQVLWLTPPNMGKTDLNQKMQFLIQVIQQEIEKEGVGLIDTRHVLSETKDEFRQGIQTEKGFKKLRTADGIHFTTEGQKLIAQAILDQIKVVSHD